MSRYINILWYRYKNMKILKYEEVMPIFEKINEAIAEVDYDNKIKILLAVLAATKEIKK